jgi:hypothetical protein
VKAKNIEGLRSTENLLEAIRLCLYGEKLYKTRAVAVLEEYYSARDSLIGGPISARANLLLAMTDAIDNQKSEFLTEFAKAYKIRTRKALKDHWKLADFVLRRIIRHCLVDPVTKKASSAALLPIPIEEIEELFADGDAKKNVPRLIDELNMRKPEWIKLRLTTDWQIAKK